LAAGTKAKKADQKRAAVSSKVTDLPVLSFATARAFATWLGRNHAKSSGAWLKIAKKTGSANSLSYSEAVEVALAWGWIDGQKQRHDENSWLQRFTPRRPRSGWSEINREKALALIAAGKMQPPGQAQVDQAQRDGRWDTAYAPASRATVPPDLAAALAKNARASQFFETLEARNRYAILYRIQTAKTEATRAARILKFVAQLARHEKLHP
jgi:uncharacterized protein YdeI (YjbR/CyaY-like superfamily)